MKLSINYAAIKPGWARVNFNYFISKYEASFIIDAVSQIAEHGWKLLPLYVQDLKSGQFFHQSLLEKSHHDGNSIKVKRNTTSLLSLSDLSITTGSLPSKNRLPTASRAAGNEYSKRSRESFKTVLAEAKALYQKAGGQPPNSTSNAIDFMDEMPQEIEKETDIWWLLPSEAQALLNKSKTLGMNQK